MNRILICGLVVLASLGAFAGKKGPRKAVFGTGGNEASLVACCRFTGKEHPKTLLFETPAGDDEGTIKRRTEGLLKGGAEVEVVRMWKQKIDPVELRKKMMDADLIWMGSGATEQLLYKIDQYFLEETFHAAYRNGTVLAGNSAGSLIQAYAGYNDFNDGRYDLIRGMGMIRAYFVPHYQAEVWQGFDKRLEQETDPNLPDEGWAVENGAGVFFTDEKPEVRIVTGGLKEREKARAFHFVRKDGKWTKTVVPAVSISVDGFAESKL